MTNGNSNIEYFKTEISYFQKQLNFHRNSVIDTLFFQPLSSAWNYISKNPLSYVVWVKVARNEVAWQKHGGEAAAILLWSSVLVEVLKGVSNLLLIFPVARPTFLTNSSEPRPTATVKSQGDGQGEPTTSVSFCDRTCAVASGFSWKLSCIHPHQGWLVTCYGVTCIPSKVICLSPNPKHLRMWPYRGGKVG